MTIAAHCRLRHVSLKCRVLVIIRHIAAAVTGTSSQTKQNKHFVHRRDPIGAPHSLDSQTHCVLEIKKIKKGAGCHRFDVCLQWRAAFRVRPGQLFQWRLLFLKILPCVKRYYQHLSVILNILTYLFASYAKWKLQKQFHLSKSI